MHELRRRRVAQGAIYEVDATRRPFKAGRKLPGDTPLDPKLFVNVQDGGPSWGKFTHDYTR